jgi:HlyD family secretion protein
MKAVPSRLLLATVAVAVLLGGGYLVLGAGLWNRGLPEGLIQVNGRIEGDHLTVASKFPGRIQELLAREGDHVTAGQVMLRIDDVQTRARVDQARHAWAAIEAQVQSAHTALAVLNLEVPLAIESAQSRVDEAKAEVEKAKAVEHEARVDEQRLRNLLPEEAVAQQQYDQAFARWNVAKSTVQVERSTLAKTTKELAQAELGWKRIRAKEDEVAALERQRDQSEAALNEAESVLADLTIRAPALGTVTARMVDVG